LCLRRIEPPAAAIGCTPWKHLPARRSAASQQPFVASTGGILIGPRRHPRKPADRHPDYLRVIGALVAKYDSQHSKKSKGVSFTTMHDRQRMVVSFFHELRLETPYRNLDPRQLANRHIEAMVARWLERGLATATIHNYLTSCERSRAGSARRAWCASPSSTWPLTRRTPIDRKSPRKTAAGRP
jgi:hypothetical protein